VTFIFKDEPVGKFIPLKIDQATCNQEIPNGEIFGYKNITKCTCNFCDAACNKTAQHAKLPSFMNGFRWILVGSTYGALTLGVIIVSCIKKRIQL